MCKDLSKLKEHFLQKEGEEAKSVCIVFHPNPDPDCIGSAKAMERLIKHWNPATNVTIIYDGEISHPQNKTLVKVLNINMVHRNELQGPLSSVADHFIVLDVMPDRCDLGDIKPIAVIDHHPVDTKVVADF